VLALDTETRARELYELGRQIVAEQRPGYDPDLELYHGIWREDDSHAASLVRYHEDLLRLAGVDPAGKSVLDAGCGYGFTLLLYGLFGAGELYGIDVDEARISTVQAYRDLLPADLARRLSVGLGDVAALDFPDSSVDIMLSIEAVGVYLDLDAFAAEAARVLRPGGTLLIAEANNALNPRLRARTLEIWEAYEQGEPGQVVHHHRIVSPYVERRQALIASAHPELDEAEARRLAERTSGLTEAQVEEAVSAHLAGGPEPDRPYSHGDLPIAPEGIAVERMVDPYELARLLGRHGFQARAHGYWGGAGGSLPVRAANRLLALGGRLSIRTAPAFRVIATRA
jgi:SAM-dependent methyltransferase